MTRSRLIQFIVISLLIFVHSGVSGQALKNIPADSLRQDLNVLKATLEKQFPSLHRYVSPAHLNKLFDSCAAALQTPATELQLLKMTKLLVSALEDGHLYCGPSTHLRQYLNEKAKFFPLRLQFIADKAYILRSADNSLPAGTEIVAINGRSVNEIREELFRYIASDGNIHSKKYHVLDKVFYFYYLLAYGEQPGFDLQYKTGAGPLQSRTITAVPAKDIPSAPADQPRRPLELSFRDDIAILTIHTFDLPQLKEANEDFPSFIERSFDTIRHRNIKQLIIDLRGNGGGRDLYGSLLYSYLTDKPVAYYRSLTAATKDLPYSEFRRGATSYNDLDASMLSPSGGAYQLSKAAHDNLGLVQPAPHPFKGEVWFLIDGLSFSTTAEFCAIARSNNRGKFIGEETGGAYHGNTSLTLVDLILPVTKTEISIPVIKYEMAVNSNEYTDRGTIPDYIVLPTITDIMQGRDPQLDQALKLAGHP